MQLHKKTWQRNRKTASAKHAQEAFMAFGKLHFHYFTVVSSFLIMTTFQLLHTILFICLSIAVTKSDNQNMDMLRRNLMMGMENESEEGMGMGETREKRSMGMGVGESESVVEIEVEVEGIMGMGIGMGESVAEIESIMGIGMGESESLGENKIQNNMGMGMGQSESVVENMSESIMGMGMGMGRAMGMGRGNGISQMPSVSPTASSTTVMPTQAATLATDTPTAREPASELTAAPTNVDATANTVSPTEQSPIQRNIVRIGDHFMSFVAPLATREPTREEYDEMVQRIANWFEKAVTTEYNNKSNRTLMNVECVSDFRLYGINRDIPPRPENFNIYINFDYADYAFMEEDSSNNGDVQLPAPADLFSVIRRSLTTDFILDVVRTYKGTPFESVNEIFLAAIKP